jgi:hypothetical protein
MRYSSLLMALCASFALFSASPAAADDLPMDAGILGAINFLHLDVDRVETSSQVGATFGAYYNVELDPLFSIEVDAMYSYVRFEAAGIGLSQHRIGVPVLARWWFFPGASLGMGPFALLNLEGGSDNGGGGGTESDADVGVVASTSMKYPFGRLQTVLDVRYLWGFADTDAGIGTRELQLLLGVGYFF